MSAYYNENDKRAAAWLRELIKENLIAPGDVDERSILDVRPHELTGYTQHHFFAGIGGWSYALRLAGWPDSRPVRTGSCPCQPFSVAGQGKGEADERHLWPNFRDLITFGEPAITFGEQVASTLGREWLARVRADLEGLGYEVGAADLCAASVGAPHIRQRLFWVANPASMRGPKQRNEPRQGSRRGADPSDSAECSRPRRVAVADGGDACAEREQRGREQRFEQEDGGAGERVGDTESRGCGEQRDASFSGSSGHAERPGGAGPGGMAYSGHESERRAPRCGEEESRRSLGDVAGRGPWSTFDIIPCRDGKARRVEAGTFPLAHGLPARMVRLRGYGNAIVPELAAQFIQASLEALV